MKTYIFLLLVVPILTSVYPPVRSFHSAISRNPILLSKLKPEILAASFKKIPDYIKSGLKLATYSINFKKIAFACYYTPCWEGLKLKADIENAFKGEKMLNSSYFIVSFVEGPLEKTMSKLVWGGFWMGVFKAETACATEEDLKTMVSNTPMFYFNRNPNGDIPKYPGGLSMHFGTLDNLQLTQSQLTELPPPPQDLDSQQLFTSALTQLQSYANHQNPKFGLFQQLLITGLAKPYESFLDTPRQQRIDLYYNTLCKDKPSPMVIPISSETKGLMLAAGIGGVLILIDLIVRVVIGVLRRGVLEKNGQFIQEVSLRESQGMLGRGEGEESSRVDTTDKQKNEEEVVVEVVDETPKQS